MKLTIWLPEKSIKREIGRGAYSRVFAVKYARSIFPVRGEYTVYAAREIHSFIVEGVGKRQIRNNLIQECEHCSDLSHPNIA